MAELPMNYGLALALPSHLREIGCRAYVLNSTANPKIAVKSVECMLVGYLLNAKSYQCWHRESGRIVDSHHVTFVEHLNDQPQVSCAGTDAVTTPHAGEDVTASIFASQMTGDDSISLSLGGTALPLAPSHARLDEQPRRSTRN